MREKFPHFEVLFYSGTEEKLMEAFLAHKLDLLLLSENSVVKMDGYCLKEIELPCTSTMMSGSSLTVELVGEKQSKLTAFWKQDNKSQLITEFLKYSDEISHYI